ncbi:MAG: hypothetical protein JWM85_441, partial [Acidimicrobiaceae bacterium]|nr:hypothetical protein [Acidimicrobiaceae bacterium]
GAIHAAANTAQGFHAMFNRLTGPAEKIGAQIIQQAMKVGEAFLPTIGASAAQNMGIIKKDLQPLFAWFQNPGAQGGLGIFKNLEKIFTGQLPMAIKTLTQGVELFARTINVAAGYTGKFMPKLEAFLARANSPTGFAKWSKDIGKLIGDFRIWEHFMMAVARAFTGLLGPAQGTGKGIVVVLTGMIDKFDKWERSAKGMASLTSLLSAHKAELINILKLLPPLVAAFGKIELTAGPALTTVVSLLAKFVGLVLKIPGVGTILAFGVAFAVIASKMKLLGAFGAFFTGAGKDASVLERAFASLGSGAAALLTKITTLVVGEDAMNAATGAARAAMVALTTVGILVVAAGVYELIKHFGVLHGLMIAGAVAVVGLTVAFWALDAVPVVALVVGIALAIAGLVAGIIELVKHWDTVWKTIKDVTSTAITFVKNHLSLFAMGLGAIFLGPLGLLVGYFLTHWDTIKKDATAAWNAITSFVKGVPGKILGTLSSLGSDIANVAKAAWHLFQNGVSTGTTDVINFVKGIPKKILAALGDVGSLLLDAGKMIITGLENGIKNAAKGAVDAVKNVGKDIISGVKSALHIFSPSQDMVEAGQYVIQGLQNGISDTGTSAAIMTTIQNLAGKMLTYLKTQVPLWHAIGVSFMQGLSAGIASASAQVAAAAVKAANDAVTATKTATKTSSPSQVFAEQGGYWMLGIVQGITANKGRVQSALTSSIPTMGKSNSGYVGAVAGGGIVINSNPIININGATGNPANVGDAVRKAIEQANDHLVMSIRAGAGMAN